MTSPAPNAPALLRCPACGEPGTGRFCSACGASLGGATCAGCDAPLSPGARFCHRCGLAAGAAAPTRPAAARDRTASLAPWAVAFVALLALAANFAGRNFASAKGSAVDGSANALPQASLGEGGAAANAPFAGGGGGGRPPNLASMSPREIADRLFDRVMALSTQGKADSATFFAQMALQNYAGMGDLDLDQRYDMGRVAEVAGQADVMRAQADTILQRNPTHLLGLVLATKAASMRNDAKALAEYRDRLLAADRSGERQRGLEEYQRHANDIDDAVKAAKGAK
ncbi:Double zinc ribbon [Gemmatirosa kalamazoonensis]|uniref:Double zinc ribbon n=1 Tax=Gemmatirosa kalamazoonensis TaxID=861299 RepID=W0RF24_9BACT|nr:zinc ribbon domain-containing protein [Gemmatirosa kalamazoonensis]AHG87983.1 Double zinc ribbon [Gemmatirosa kalamazoonensis]